MKKNVSKFVLIGLSTIFTSSAALAAGYQVIDSQTPNKKWYEPEQEKFITVKAGAQPMIVLQSMYRQEDEVSILPANSEKKFEYHPGTNCFRFIDETKTIKKRCF